MSAAGNPASIPSRRSCCFGLQLNLYPREERSYRARVVLLRASRELFECSEDLFVILITGPLPEVRGESVDRKCELLSQLASRCSSPQAVLFRCSSNMIDFDSQGPSGRPKRNCSLDKNLSSKQTLDQFEVDVRTNVALQCEPVGEFEYGSTRAHGERIEHSDNSVDLRRRSLQRELLKGRDLLVTKLDRRALAPRDTQPCCSAPEDRFRLHQRLKHAVVKAIAVSPPMERVIDRAHQQIDSRLARRYWRFRLGVRAEDGWGHFGERPGCDINRKRPFTQGGHPKFTRLAEPPGCGSTSGASSLDRETRGPTCAVEEQVDQIAKNTQGEIHGVDPVEVYFVVDRHTCTLPRRQRGLSLARSRPRAKRVRHSGILPRCVLLGHG